MSRFNQPSLLTRPLRWLVALAALLVPSFALLSIASAQTLPSGCTQAGTTVTCRFSAPREHTFTVPANASNVRAVAIGARGGLALGGFGARVSAPLASVGPGDILYIEVGGIGTETLGGFNGGGDGLEYAGGGGGASDIRTISRNAAGTLQSRLLVAGGGGGASAPKDYKEVPQPSMSGGNAGAAGAGTVGEFTGGGGQPGTASAGGAGGATAPGFGNPGENGTLGQGGDGKFLLTDGGGGGGGLYGGGGGGGGSAADFGAGTNSTSGGGGGGGSSLVPPGGTLSITSDFPSVTIIYSVPASPTDTPTNTPTDTPTDTPTNTPVPPTDTPTGTPTNTAVPPTDTPTDTPTNTPTDTPTDTPTNTPTDTPTNTPTPTPVPPTVAVVPGGQCQTDLRAQVNLLLTDADTPANQLTLSATSSNTRVVPTANIVFGGSDATRTLTITGAQNGTARITITVSDGSLSSTLVVTVYVGTGQADNKDGVPGADIMFGLNGADDLDGQAGPDVFCGGNGNDTLTGGSGADFFSGGAGTDTATDFNTSQGDTKDTTIP